jgi:hypothetical protein
MISRKTITLICLLMLFFSRLIDEVHAQEILFQNIEFKRSGEEKVEDVLRKVSESHGFYFSYQDSIIQEEVPAPLDHFKGSIAVFLENLLGDDYEFKELPGYVIIRYAPGILDVDAQLEKNPRQLIIKGFVKDKKTGETIQYASIYDRNHFNSALSDDRGYFELRTKSSNITVWLTLSKDRYKDTTFMILPAVEIEASKKNNLFKYYQEDGSAGEVEQSFFGRMFIGFQQRFQRINLGGFFAESPFQMSLTPGLSSQGMFNSQMINKFSLNLLGGYTAGVDGIEAAGVFNINQKDVRYFQVAGAVNVVGGGATGFQVAGISNKVIKNVKGVQVAGVLNHSKQQVQGVQIAGILNQSDAESAHQIAGLVNRSNLTKGLQIAGITNWTENHSKGLQVAGIFNRTSGTAHHQVAGIINKARDVKGIQLAGLINIAESSDYPLGLLNFIKNGKKSLALQLDESAFSYLTFRSGGKVFYGLLGAGYGGWFSDSVYSLEAGLGAYLVDHPVYTMDLEVVGQVMSDFDNTNFNTSSLRILNGIRIHRHLKFFIAPTLSFNTMEKDEAVNSRRFEVARRINDQRIWLLELGAIGGLQYVF